MNFILAIDQGTTGSTAALICADSLKFVAKANFEFEQHFPNAGEVEHDLNDIWQSVQHAVKAVLEKQGIDGNAIKAIGITNQRETTCAFRKDSSPLARAIVWQDRRTAQWCSERQEHAQSITSKTGLPLDPYFSATKMNWLLNNNSNVKKALEEDDLRFGTIDTYLLHRLTAGNSFATDRTNASRTMLYNILENKSDPELLDFFQVPAKCLPTVKDSFDHFGSTQGLDFLPDGIPIHGILGDQQAALYGQACFSPGELKCTYGTGAFLVANTGETPIFSKNGLLTTIAYSDQGKTTYALEGSAYIAGAAVQWLRDNLKFFANSAEVEELAKSADTSRMQELLFLPFFSGIGSPHWKPNAKGAIINIDRGTDQAEIARACLEGIALGVNDIIDSFRRDHEQLKINCLNVDGGATQNNLLMKIQANFSTVTIQRPAVIETTAYGAALAAYKGINQATEEELRKLWKLERSITADEQLSYYDHKKSLYEDYIQKLF